MATTFTGYASIELAFMKKIVITILLIIILAAAVPALAQSIDTSTPKTVELTDEQAKYPLGLYLETLEDVDGKLSIEDISSPAYDTRFVPSQQEVPNFGLSDSAYWVRFHMKNATRDLDQWLLEVGFANSQYVDLYLPNTNGTGWIVKQSGILRPFNSRDVPYRHIVFDLPLPPQGEQTFYMRFYNEASMTLPLILWQREAFFREDDASQFMFGFYYGALLMILLYNLFVLYSLRDASHLIYVCFLAGIILFSASYDGLAAEYFWPNLARINYFAPQVLMAFCFASILMFTDSFLEIKSRDPRLHKLILIMLTLWAGLFLAAFLFSYHTNIMIFIPLGIASMTVVLAAGLLSWQSGYLPARFFLFSWIVFFIGVIMILLVREAVMSSTLLNENLFRVGMLWLAAFWSISLTDRVNLLKAEMENANQALRGSERQLSQILEGLPLAVVVYGKDRRPSYGNKRTFDILTNQKQGIRPDISAGRTLEKALQYYSLKLEGSDLPYPVEKFPVHSALQGKPAYTDDVEVNDGDRRIPLEIWASPMKDENGNIESAVVAFQDITLRKQEAAELSGYRIQLEALVNKRTNELNQVNEKLLLRLDWLSAVNTVHQAISGAESLDTAYQALSERILQIFHATLVFIIQWDRQDAQTEVISCSRELVSPQNKKHWMELFQEGTYLRREIERGGLMTCSPEQSDFFSTLFSESFPDQNVPSLILAPIMIGPSAIGVLGVAVGNTTEPLLQDESDLVKRMALDLASLAQGAILLDQAVMLATIEERNRLARDLHDSVTQTLFTASVLAEATPHIWDKDTQIARQNMNKLSRLIRGALAEMRSMLIELRQGSLQQQTLEQLLSTLVDGARARSQASITLSLMNDIPHLTEKTTIAIYRVAREALINATVHSGATQIQVKLGEEKGQLVLQVWDNGCGFNPQAVPAGHLGLNIMEERAEEIGARLEIQSEPGQGTNVRIAWTAPMVEVKVNEG